MEEFENEIWKDIKGYEGLYQVSNMGRIKNIKNNKNRWLYLNINVQGYLQVSLSKNGRAITKRVNRLVAEAFIPNPKNLPQVNHKNEIETDNRASNLEWMTSKQNCNYGNRNKNIAKARTNNPLTSDIILQYDKQGNFIKEWPSSMEIERCLGYSASNVRYCCRGIYKTSKGYIWKYKTEK